jgi:Ni/Co efflux regulator RcnB
MQYAVTIGGEDLSSKLLSNYGSPLAVGPNKRGISMRTFLIGAAALLIAASSPAVADHHHGGSGGGGGGNRPAGGMHMGGGGGNRSGGGMRMGGGHASGHFRAGNPRVSGGFRVGRPVAHHFSVAHRGHFTAHVGHVRMSSHRYRVSGHHAHFAVRRGLPAARFDVSRLHRVFHASRRFHAGLYNRPYGWYSYNWRLGERLPRGWFGREYWIGDWGSYGLFAPPDGLVWVRVGPDGLLIDEDSGEIVDIYTDLFW